MYFYATMKELKIILVEDNEWDIDLMNYSLKQKKVPYELEIYNHGVAAFRLFEKMTVAPDIIILDQNLPGVNGVELLRTIKKNELLRNVPVLAMSNACPPEYIQQLQQEGANKFINKPMDVKDMGAVIDTIVQLTATQAK
ncbi:MAG: response regulator receiver protein [Flavipsychrobacter sp.]|nr:response regulator receiver protein [Flavipsychrobacter sp.]